MKRIRLTALLLTGALAAMTPLSALAVGTPACTTITNNAALTYSVSGVPQAEANTNLAPAEFVVGNKVIVTVEKSNGAAIPVVPNSTAAQLVTASSYLSFTVTNGGNALQDYTLSAAALVGAADPFSGAADSFDLSGVTAYVDVNNNMTYDAGDTVSILTQVDPTATYNAGLPIGTRMVFVVPTGGSPVVPDTQASGTQSVYALEAVSNQGNGSADTPETQNDNDLIYKIGGGTCTADIVLAEDIHTSNVAGEIKWDGKDNARNTFKVNTAIIAISKSSDVVSDPVNGIGPVPAPKAIPGAVIRYTISITNTGDAPATLTTISDTLANSLEIIDTIAGASWSVTGSTRTTTSGTLTADANAADGLAHSDPTTFGGTLTATMTTILGTEAGYATTGLLKKDETVNLVFDVTLL